MFQPQTTGRKSWPAACCVLLIVCGLPAAARGQCSPANGSAATPHVAVARVENVGLNGSRYYGSGTLVYKDAQWGIVLTCAHLFRQETGSVAVTFPQAGRFEASVVSVDTAWDLAALRISPPASPAVTIAENYPRPGELLSSCGYGQQGRYWCNCGRALGYVRTAGTATYETLELSGCAREGDSGGPVFNGRGELVAVVWGTDGRTVGGTYCGRIRKFLAGILGRGPWSYRPPPEPSDPLVPVRPPASVEPPVPANPGPAPVPSLAGVTGRLDGLSNTLEALGQRLGNLGPPPDAEAIGKALDPVVADRLAGLAKAATPWVLGALGLTSATPIGLGVWGLVGLLRARRKTRAARSTKETDAGPPPEGRPPPQITRRNREFVSYQVPDRRLKALQWAHDEYVRRFPGARPVIETVEAYADQYESGMGE